MMIVFLLLVDLESKIKQDEYAGALKAAVEAYESALDDFQRQKAEAALAKLRPILAKPTGLEDRKIILTRYDRQLGRDITVGEHDFYPYQLAGKCLLASAKGESDKTRAMAMLKEAKGFLENSTGPCQAESSKAILRQVNDAISKLESEAEPSGPTPEEKAAKDAKRLMDAGDFVGAAAVIEKNHQDALKDDLAKAERKFLGVKWAEAEDYLDKFKPTRKIGILADELKALVPSKVTGLSPEFKWVQDLAAALEASKGSGTVEALKSDPTEALLLRAVEMEQATLVKVALDIRFEVVSGAIRRAVKAAKDGSFKEIAARSKEVQELIETCPAVDEVLLALSRFDPAVFGDEAAGGYDALLKKLQEAMEDSEFSRCHREVQGAAHYLRAALTALEGFRRGESLADVRKACEPALKKSRELAPNQKLDVPLSPKVRAALN
jgi:hypothetical protein